MSPRDYIYSGLVAALSCAAGTPWAALPFIFIVNLLLTLYLRRQSGARFKQALGFARGIPKAIQFLCISLGVTALFAMERQVDVIPNAFGFLELLGPTVVSAILFDVSGGLFCAALIVIYAFQVFVPPRFPFILDVPSLAMTLLAFATTSLLTALHFSALADAWARRMGLQDEWSVISLRAAGPSRTRFPWLAVTWQRFRAHVLWPLILVLGYALFWSTFAWISSGNGIHIDSLEAYAWGREFVFGYYKHPPFWAWIAGLWFSVMPKSDWNFLLLSELNAGLGLAGAWAVMGRFCDQRTRTLAVLLLMLTPFYQFNAQRFNANTILLSIWPWTIYFFIRSLEANRIIYALACGLLAGCALLSKYFAFVLIATCFVAALTHDRRSQYFRSAMPYISTMVALIAFLPHLLWLVRDGFQPLGYLAEKIDLADRHISNSYFQFIGAQIAFFAVPALILIAARRRYGRVSHATSIAVANGPSFLGVLALAPFIFTLGAGTVGHAALAVPFGVPIFALVPLCLILLIQAPVEPALRWAARAVIGLSATCILISPFLPAAFMRWGGSGYQEPRYEVADVAMRLWDEQTHRPLRYVSGERSYSLAMTFRSRDQVSEFNQFNFRWSPWVSRAKLAKDGLLVVCQVSDLSCLQRAQSFADERTIRIDRSVRRAVGSVIGRSWDYAILIMPPA